jgi:sugar lactone lactonase YvrE
MGWDGMDRLWVPNAFDGRYTVFDSAGTVLKTVRTPGGRAIKALLYPTWFDGSGAFLDHVSMGGDVQIIRRDTTGATLDTLALIREPDRGQSLNLPLRMYPDAVQEAARNFRPRLVWTIAPDGTLWHGRSDELRLIHRTTAGDTIRIVETAHRRTDFTPREQALVAEAERQLDVDADFRPQILQAIYVLDDGHVLAQIAGEMNAVGDTFDVFDPQGRYLGEMTLPFALEPRALTALRGDTIAGVTLGAMDVPYVVRASLERP